MYHQNRTGAAGSDISQSVYGSKENKISTGTLSDQPARGESGIQEYKVRQCTVYGYNVGKGARANVSIAIGARLLPFIFMYPVPMWLPRRSH